MVSNVQERSLTDRVCGQMFGFCQYEREVVSRCRFNLYFFYYGWGRACFLMFCQLFLFSRRLLIFISLFSCRFAGHLGLYFRNINSLPIYVTGILCQVVLSDSLFLHCWGAGAVRVFFFFLSNHVYKSFPLDSETLRSLPTQYMEKFPHIFSSTCLFSFLHSGFWSI